MIELTGFAKNFDCTEEHKEKKQKLLYLVQDEIAHIGINHPLLLPHVGIFVSEAFVWLQSGKQHEAWSALWTAYKCLLPTPEVNRLYCFADKNKIEKLKNELIILDLGIFAYRLDGSFLQLHEVVPYLWEKRKDFYPHLSGTLRATYWFICSIEAGRNLEEALSNALSVRNELHDAFGDRYIYHEKNIGELLTPDALAELKQILLTIASELHSHGHKR